MRKTRQQTLADTGIFHKFWLGHNRSRVLNTDDEKRAYLRALRDTHDKKIAPFVQWHSFCIMSNHPHEVGAAPGNPKRRITRRRAIEKLGNWMRSAHSCYGRFYNAKHKRMGAVAAGRPKTEQLKSDRDVLKAMFYGDANPVKARLASHPIKYRWSSAKFYCTGETNEFTKHLNEPTAYTALGRTPKQRQRCYMKLLNHYLRLEGLLKDVCPDEGESIALPESMPIDLAIQELMAGANNIRGRPPG
jgi:putative transposase